MNDFLEHNSTHRRRRTAVWQGYRNQIIFILIFALILGAVIVFLMFKDHSSDMNNLQQLQGTWKYDEYTQYEFDGIGNGCMCLEDLHYEYTYTVKDNKLKLDFKDDSVRDCTYTFLIKGSSLILNGEEGTVGGSYELHKQD